MPEKDLKQWRYEGVIYRRNQDPKNPEGKYIFQAPDVVKGSDGRYYLYYMMGGFSVVSVAVCDTPAGEYGFYGYVHYADGTLLGEKAGDQPQFDPGVLEEDGKDGDEEDGYIANMKTGATAGFKYFECKGIYRVTIRTRGFATGKYYVKTAWDGERLGSIDIDISDEWKEWSAAISIPDGVHALCFEYEDMGNPSLASFELE